MDFTNIINYIFEKLAAFGGKLIFTLVLLFVGLKLVKWFKKWFRTSPRLSKMDDGLRSFLASFASVTLYILLFITAAMTLGIPTTSFITALASGGVAIGLAMQGSLANLAGGIMLLIFKPFKVGDYIDASGEQGTVSEITVFYTILKTLDNKSVTIPNGNLTNSVIKNYSAEELRRVDIDFTASYNADVDGVKAILMDICTSHPKALSDPTPFARLTSHGDNALVYTVRVWCKAEDYWDVNFDIKEEVKRAFDAKGIEIPYPQMDVHITGQGDSK